MRKKKKIIPIAMIGLSLFLFPLDVLAAEGKTTLEILPLNEKYPRIYAINDLDFGNHELTEYGKDIKATENLTIKILDARLTSIPWDLQVNFSSLTQKSDSPLTNANISLKPGTVTTEKGQVLKTYPLYQNLDEPIFQTVLRSDSNSAHGWITYTINRDEINLNFGKNNRVGEYQALNQWRFINAKF